MSNNQDSPFLNQKEAAAYLRMAKHTFRRHVAPHIPTMRVGYHIIRYRRRDLDQWIRDHETGGHA